MRTSPRPAYGFVKVFGRTLRVKSKDRQSFGRWNFRTVCRWVRGDLA
jgi:hypothetical protein